MMQRISIALTWALCMTGIIGATVPRGACAQSIESQSQEAPASPSEGDGSQPPSTPLSNDEAAQDSSSSAEAPADSSAAAPSEVPSDPAPLVIDVPPVREVTRTTVAAGAKGAMTGKVLDAEYRQPLPNARVGAYTIAPGDSAWTMVAGAATELDGKFRLPVPVGTYRLIVSLQSYTPTVREDLKVLPESIVDVTLILTPKPIQIQGVQVKGEVKAGTEAGALLNQKKAAVVSDAVTSEQIGKTTDSNAAEALQRVTGLSVVEGKYVFVRGLGERYSSTQVNGSTVSSPEPNKRVVPLDVFPAGVLDQVVVQKTYTPDQDAEFAGGVVSLSTKDFVQGHTFTPTASIGYSANAVQRSYLSYPGGKLDFLGFDDGTRALPDLIPKDQRATQSTLGGPGFPAEQLQEMGRSFQDVWEGREQHASPNYAVGGAYSGGFKVLGKDAGFLGSVSLTNDFVSLDRQNNAYAGLYDQLAPIYTYQVTESVGKTLGGALANFSLRPSASSTIRLRGLYTRSSEDATRISNGPNFDYGTPGVRIEHLGYVERGLSSGAVSGEQTLSGLGHLVYRHWQTLSTPQMYGAFALVGALGLLLTRGLRAVQTRTLRWQDEPGRL